MVFTGEPLASVREKELGVGAVRSIVTNDASLSAVGPVLPAVSVTPLAYRRATTVPLEQLATVTVIELPEVADGVKTQPVAVPVLAKSADSIPLTDSEKVSVYDSEAELVGLLGGVQEAVGAVLSIVTLEATAAVAGPVLPAVSVTPLAARFIMTVPAEQLATVTVIDAPEAADGVKAQPVAVPVLVKSAAVIPETDSEKVRV